MEKYQEWQEEEDDDIPIKYPIHNFVVSPSPNQPNYRPAKIIQSNYIHRNEQIYTSPRYIIQGNDKKNNYNNNNNSNQNNY